MGRTRTKPQVMTSVEFKCDRGGKHRSRRTGEAIRNSGTRLIECPFSWKASLVGGIWKLKCEKDYHNHQPEMDMSGHPIARRLGEAQQETVALMTASGSQPREIISALRQAHPDVPLVARTVYNERVKIRQTRLDGRTPIRAATT